jgi:hypothetical protein
MASTSISSSLLRKLRRVANDKKTAYAVGEALELLAGIVLKVAHDQNSKKELDEMEKGRRSMLLLEIHGHTMAMSEKLLQAATAPDNDSHTPTKLHLSHLQQ